MAIDDDRDNPDFRVVSPCRCDVENHFDRENQLLHLDGRYGRVRYDDDMGCVMRFIGDVHGKFAQYERLRSSCSESVQIGDMGVGFRGSKGQEPPLVFGHRYIRGNHDNPKWCQSDMAWIPDGHVENDMMFVGGALSIDRAHRTEGLDWWADEELSIEELNILVDKYVDIRPRIMVTHECPEEVAAIVAGGSSKMFTQFSSRTRQAFQSMWSAHSPELWVFGHWHKSFDQMANGTRFICLAELEYKDLEI